MFACWLLDLFAAHLHKWSPWQSTWPGRWREQDLKHSGPETSEVWCKNTINWYKSVRRTSFQSRTEISCVIPQWIERISFWQLKKILSKWCLFKTSLCPVLSKLAPHTSSYFLSNSGKVDLKVFFTKIVINLPKLNKIWCKQKVWFREKFQRYP